MTGEMNADFREKILANIPLARFGTVDEVSDAVCFLLTARYITGQVLQTDGGLAI
jgi:3-oxoacyl-[acyl-carrier protein] reductase